MLNLHHSSFFLSVWPTTVWPLVSLGQPRMETLCSIYKQASWVPSNLYLLIYCLSWYLLDSLTICSWGEIFWNRHCSTSMKVSHDSYMCYVELPKKSQGYIQVFLDGGLNQQRMGVCKFSCSICFVQESVTRMIMCSDNNLVFLQSFICWNRAAYVAYFSSFSKDMWCSCCC